MRMRVDEAGDYYRIGRLNCLSRRPAFGQIIDGADHDNMFIADGNGGVVDNFVILVHCDYSSVQDYQIKFIFDVSHWIPFK